MLYNAKLVNKKTKREIAIGVAKWDERGFYKFNLIPTLHSKPFINITKHSSNEVVTGEIYSN
ncbi:hypothetical protein [Heyndrickxia camelliae]|uniref:Uncharacterized protein n=1 Tax=Heyndrickxia camelliae TaxID=1707093 RepID=A0A2N3LE11_9BACI|nr:hypothetical protein [Heyndrickxia camelliae]PKR82882.1 hypothetical protein CWO92_22085 [Heyndrickxia camelliae]